MPAISAGEADALAVRMAQNYQDSIEYYRDVARSHFNLTPQEQHDEMRAKTDGLRNPDEFWLERVAQTPLHEVDWWDLETVENAKAGGALELFTRIKEAARAELRTGQRAADAVSSTKDLPFERARYLVLREELAEVWQPKNGIEQNMIDQMAQAQTMYFHWMKITHTWTTFQYKGITKQEERYEAPRLSEIESLDHAMTMSDRFQKMFLRTARALQNMRRFSPVTIVQNNGGQVNVGAQQVNVAQVTSGIEEAEG